MEFKRTELELVVYGETFRIKFPTLGELGDFETNAKSEGSEIGITADFLDTLGLPRDTVLAMEPGHVSQVIEALTLKKS